MDSLFGAAIDKRELEVEKGAGILKKTLTSATRSYQPKKQKIQRTIFTTIGAHMTGINDPPPISEDDINQGMISLVSKGIIPKDVDLTPAFEKGAPPVTCKGIKFYDKRELHVKREIMTGAVETQTFKYDLQPNVGRMLVPI